MLRSFGIGGTWTSAGFRAPGMWSMWEGGSTTVGFAQRGASLPAPRGCETLWQAVLDDESTPRVLAEIGRIDGGLSAQDHKYEARWDWAAAKMTLWCADCQGGLKVDTPGNKRSDAPLRFWKRHCGGERHLRRVRDRVAAASAAPAAAVTVDDHEVKLMESARSGATTLRDAAAMPVKRRVYRTIDFSSPPSSSSSSSSGSSPPTPRVNPTTHLGATYPGVFVADAGSGTFFCLVCKENQPGLYHAAFGHNTHLHVTTGKHARIVEDRRLTGGGLFRYGCGPVGTAEVQPATMPPLSRGFECLGYWRPECSIGGTAYEMAALAERSGGGFVCEALAPRVVETVAPHVLAVAGCGVSVGGKGGVVVSGASDWAGGLFVRFSGGGSSSLSSSSSTTAASSSLRLVDLADVDSASVTVPPTTYRSVGCAWHCVDETTGERDPYLMCWSCKKLPRLDTVRNRLYRGREGEVDEKTNLGFYPPARLLERAQSLASENRGLKSRAFLLEQMLLKTKQRAAKMKERLRMSFLEGDAKRMVDDLAACAKAGALGDATALSFISDLVHAHRLSSVNCGKGRRRMRWSAKSKRIFTVLQVYGGPRSLRLFSQNAEGVSVRQVQRMKADLMHHFNPGTDEEAIKYVASVYKDRVAALGLPRGEVVLVETAEDETGILADLVYDGRRDAVLGSCGKSGDGHKCDFSHMTVLGSDGAGGVGSVAAKVDSECDDYVRAGHARLVILNPLHDQLPRMVISFSPTCNKFTAADVGAQWDDLQPLLKKHLEPIGMEVVGCASDGDARRFKQQKQQMQEEPGPGYSKFHIEHPSALLFARKNNETGVVTRVHSQDCIHGAKKMYNASDNAARALMAASYEVTHNHSRLSFTRFGAAASMMDKSAFLRDDRQDFENVVRASSTGNDKCLEKMQQPHADLNSKRHAPVRTQGSRWYFSLIRQFTRMHLSTAMTVEERVEVASFVLNSLRFWRNYIYHGKHTLTLKDNYLAKQTHDHIALECESVMVTLKLMGQKHPSVPADLRAKGSDGCETCFSRMGGHGDVQSGRRNFTFAQGLNLVATVNLLARLGSGEDGLDLSNPNRKAEYKPEFHDPPEPAEGAEAREAGRRRHPSPHELVLAVQRGVDAARDAAEKLGMKLVGVEGAAQLMDEPWLSDDTAALKGAMRDADDADGADSLLGVTVEVTKGGDTHGCSGVAVGFKDGAYSVQLKAADGSPMGVHFLTRSQVEPAEPAAAEAAAAGAAEEVVAAAAAQDFESVLERLGDGAVGGLASAQGGGGGGDDDDEEKEEEEVAEEEEEEVAAEEEEEGREEEGGGGGACAVAAAVARAPCTLTVQRGAAVVSIHKSTYLNEQKQLQKGGRLETDRLKRVQAAALQSLRGLHSSGSGELMLEHGADFALKVGGGKWWLGRVNQTLRPVGKRGCKVALAEPVSLNDARSQGVVVTGSYFRRGNGGTSFTHAPTGDDTCTDGAQYSAQAIMSMVRLEYEKTTSDGDHVYQFSDPDLVAKLDALAKVGEGEAATAAEKADKEKQSKKRTASQNGDDEAGAGRAAQKAKTSSLIPGVSRSGRPTTRGRVS